MDVDPVPIPNTRTNVVHYINFVIHDNIIPILPHYDNVINMDDVVMVTNIMLITNRTAILMRLPTASRRRSR